MSIVRTASSQSIEVTTRLWPVSVIGRRTYRNTESLFNKAIRRGKLKGRVLVTSDGSEYCGTVVGELLGLACVYAQVIKTCRNNRVTRGLSIPFVQLRRLANEPKPGWARQLMEIGPEVARPPDRATWRDNCSARSEACGERAAEIQAVPAYS